MWAHQIHLAFRVLQRRRLYTFINCFGLAVGVATALVIWTYADYEFSYDSWQPNSGQVYRTITAGYINGERVDIGINSGHGQGPAMKDEIPEVARYARTHIMDGGGVVSFVNGRGLPDQSREERMYCADASFVDMMAYKFLFGDPNTALSKPRSALITKSTAKRYFDTEDAVGKEIILTTGYVQGPYTVVGVLEDSPEQSHFSFDILLSMHELLQLEWYADADGPWNWANFTTYVELHRNSDPRVVEDKLPAMVRKHRGKIFDTFKGAEVITLQPVQDIHLTTNLDKPLSEKSNVQFLLLISALIILTAWLNFINLSTARATERAREVGVRKTIGASKSQLVSQFLTESLLLNAIAIGLAVGMASLVLPYIGDAFDKDLRFAPGATAILVIGAMFVFSTLATGLYPALILSSFKPASIFKGSRNNASGGLTLRKVLVVFQFTASMVLIAGTFAVSMQVNFLKTQNTGFNLERMFVVKGPRVQSKEFDTRLFTFKEQLKQLSFVKDVASSGTVPGQGENSWGATAYKKGAEGGATGMIHFVDRDFPRVYGLELLAGRVWDPKLETDMRSVLINEAAVTAYGFGTIEEALRSQLFVAGTETLDVIGVLKNYHWNSLKSPHTPIVLWPSYIYGHAYSILLEGNNVASHINSIRDLYDENFPGNPFDYYFLEDSYNSEYRADQQFGQLFGSFAALAVIIACLGLVGLASYTTLQRLKEISIRKVFGASVSSIVRLLSSQFMKLVLVSAVLAMPLIWWGVDSWLSRYPYRIDISWILFVVPFVVLVAISLFSVSVQIIRGATINPVENLKQE